MTRAGRFASEAQRSWYGGQFSVEESAAADRQRRRRKIAPKGRPALPEGGDPSWGVPIYGEDLQIGDTLVHLGRHYTITHFEDYTGSLREELGKDTRTACAGTWEITVGPDAIKRILSRTTTPHP